MANVAAVLNEQFRRLARREFAAGTKAIKKTTSHYRGEIAALKRQLAVLTKQVASLQRQAALAPASQSGAPDSLAAAVDSGTRFRADGLKAHRARLGLSAKAYGKLVGVSGLTIYNWENRKAKPRQSQLASLFRVRKMGKREAARQLGTSETGAELSRAPKTMAKKNSKRGKFMQTGEQSILLWLKRRPLTTKEINQAWKAQGRGGSADVLLGKMVKARKLKRTKTEGQRGSSYSLV